MSVVGSVWERRGDDLVLLGEAQNRDGFFAVLGPFETVDEAMAYLNAIVALAEAPDGGLEGIGPDEAREMLGEDEP
jgi:hypothetical protein